MIGDAAEDVGEPGAGIGVVEPGGDDQGVDRGGTFTAAVGTGEGSRLAAEGNATQCPLGDVVR